MTKPSQDAASAPGRDRFAVKDLKTAFDARKSFYSNRTSAIFPLYVSGTADLHIVFLNYWSLKNEIPADHLVANFRVYDGSGTLVLRRAMSRFEQHNQLSMRRLLEEGGVLATPRFEGMVEVEIVSVDNVRFTFPGLVGIYQAGNLYSCVHSAGRIKNSDESQVVSYTEESNWTCKFSDSVTPFLHYFNGAAPPAENQLTIHLRNENGTVRATRLVPIGQMGAFASRTFYADELFDRSQLAAGGFLSVRVEHNSVFPRLVVGNFFREHAFHEVTHSFPIIERKDYCPQNSEAAFQSMLCAYRSDDLDLSLTVFPTNCEGDFDCDFYSQVTGQLADDGRTERYSTALTSKSIRQTLTPEQRFLCLRLRGSHVPSRFNASFVYRTTNPQSQFSTDIASGAKSCVYPPKFRHWGHAYTNEGFETAIMLRNNSHNPEKTQRGKGVLTLYGPGIEREVPVEIAAESAKSFKVSELLDGVVGSQSGPQFLSWLLEMDVPTCETFWVAYRNDDGAIFGEHGF
jgi:hypothetical protein